MKALLIDADLRHRTVSRTLALDERAGLVDYLIGDTEIAGAVVHDPARGHWMLPCGAATLNAPDLLGSARFRALIAALRSKFDLVVLDSPPMAPIVDALVLARVADKIVYIVRHAVTPRDLTRQTITRLSEPRKIVGIVLNETVEAPTAYGGYVEASARL